MKAVLKISLQKNGPPLLLTESKTAWIDPDREPKLSYHETTQEITKDFEKLCLINGPNHRMYNQYIHTKREIGLSIVIQGGLTNFMKLRKCMVH